MNKKKSLALILSLATVFGCSEKESTEQLIAKSKQQINNGNFSEGIIQLKNAVRQSPQDAEIRLLLAKAYLGQGNGASAAKELDVARKNKIAANLYDTNIVRAYFLLDSFEDIIAVEASSSLSVEEAGMVAAYKAYAYFRIGDKDGLKSSLETASREGVNSEFLAMARISQFLSDNDVNRAVNTAKSALRSKKEYPEFYKIEADTLLANKDYAGAAELLKTYFQSQPDARHTMLLMAEAYLKANNLDEAEHYTSEVLTILPDHLYANYLMGSIQLIRENYEQANQYAEKAYGAGNSLPYNRLVAGVSAFYVKNYEKAYFHLSSIIDILAPSHPARKMFAVSQLELGQVGDIAENLQSFEVLSKEDSEFVSSIGMQLFQLGAKEDAKKLTELLGDSNEEAKLQKSFMQLMMNDPASIESFEKSLSKRQDLANHKLLLAYVKSQSGEIDKATALTKEWIDESPNKVSGQIFLASLYERKNDTASAIEILEQVAKADLNNVPARVELTRLRYREGDVEGAKTAIAEALAISTENERALSLNFAINKDDDALKLIADYVKKYPENISGKMIFAVAMLSKNKLDDALAQLPDSQFSIRTPKKAWQLKSHILKKLQKGADLKAHLVNWNKTNPYHLEAVLSLADFQMRERNYDDAISTLNKALNGQHKANKALMLAKMDLLLDKRDYREADKFFIQVKRLELSEPLLRGIEGRLQLLNGEFEQAVPNLKMFFKAFPNSKNAVMLSAALNNSDQTNEAITVLESFLEKQPSDLRVKNFLANTYLNTDQDKALNVYEELVEKQPLNLVALNNLAYLYLERDKVNEAKTLIEKAVAINNSNPAILDTYSRVLAKKGDVKEALVKSKMAFDKTNGQDVDIALQYSELLQLNNRSQRAIDVLNNIVAQTEQQKRKLEALKNK